MARHVEASNIVAFNKAALGLLGFTVCFLFVFLNKCFFLIISVLCLLLVVELHSYSQKMK